MTSDRAINRHRELRGLTLQRLQNNDDLVALLEDVGGGAESILPAFNLKRYRHDEQGPDPPDVAIAVSVVTGTSERINRLEQVNTVVQTEFEFRKFRKGESPTIGVLPWADAVSDEISAVLTSQVTNWEVGGETGGTPEPLWNEDRNRYVSVKRFDISRID